MNLTKYEIIAQDIESKILSGHYEVGMLIPTEAELRKEYDVSRHTVREAMSLLVNDNLLIRKRGAGTFVSDKFLTKNLNNSHLTVGLITTYISEYIFPSIIRGVEDELRKNNISLILSSSDYNLDLEKDALEKMIKFGVDGLIIDPTMSNKLNGNLAYYSILDEMEIPYVMINSYYEELNSFSIRNDDVKAGFLATEHLLQKGHRDILLITKIDDLQGKKRLQGYIKAHQDFKIPYRNKNIITYETKNLLTVEKILKEIDYSAVTAIVSYNDELAVDIINIFKEKGIMVPKDISIVSHDDSLVGNLSEFPLTTVAHPKEELGRDAANWIYQAISNPTKNLESIIYEPKLIIRESVTDLNE